jgi:hypothetical protein
MALARAAFITFFLSPFAGAQPPLAELLARVAEEAEVFYQNAQKVITRETLEQRAAMPPSRFRPRAGPGTSEVRQPRLQVREVVSEYSIGPLKASDSPALVEFRQVTSVDGRSIQSVESARHALSLGMRNPDEGLRKRMLEQFARHGLVDIATDYGLILLAFTKRGQADMTITPAGEGRIGPDAARALAWKQTSAAAGELAFHGKQVTRSPLQGVLWVRKSDGLPLRIEVWTEQADASKHTRRNEAAIDYVLSTHGFLTPASVVHRHRVDGRLITENLYRYDPFKLFRTESEIKFTDPPDPAGQPPAPVKK